MTGIHRRSMNCGTCSLNIDRHAIHCHQCQELRCIHCTTTCLDLDHDIRQMIICEECKEHAAMNICVSCYRESLCELCGVRAHLRHRLLPIKWPSKTATRVSMKKYEGLHCIKAILPNRQVVSSMDHPSDLKQRILKMIQLAAHPGTKAEGLQAQRLAAKWMLKYKLSLHDLTFQETPATYEVIVQFTGSLTQKARKLYQRSCDLWLAELAHRVTEIFPGLVKNYVRTRKAMVLGTSHSKCFKGIEKATWSATDLYCSLTGIICRYIKIIIKTGRFTTERRLESYVLGLVNGINVGKEAVRAENMLSPQQQDRLTLMIERSSEYFGQRPSTGHAIDINAYQQGQRDGNVLKDRQPLLLGN